MPTPREVAADTVALCSHHVSSCGVSAACKECIETALDAREAAVWEEAAIHVEQYAKEVEEANSGCCADNGVAWLRGAAYELRHRTRSGRGK